MENRWEKANAKKEAAAQAAAAAAAAAAEETDDDTGESSKSGDDYDGCCGALRLQYDHMQIFENIL